MSSGLRERRVLNEQVLLTSLAACNPAILSTSGFRGKLMKTGGLLRSASCAPVFEHGFRIEFPRFFPSVPVEIYLERPVFHPNVDAQNGFVCLWDQASPGQSVIEAIVRLQRIVAWDLLNRSEQHTMQPEALRWYDAPGRMCLPLPFEPVCEPASIRRELEWREWPAAKPRRKRLEPIVAEPPRDGPA